MSGTKISQFAATTALLSTFLLGCITSLAIRPLSQQTQIDVRNSGPTNEEQVRINWHLPVTVQTNLPVVGDNPIYLSKSIAAASNGAIQLKISEPGEMVPPFSIMDAVRDGKISAGLTWLGYDQGKIPAAPLIAAVPFGMEPWEYSAWWYHGEGRQLTENLYAQYNIHPILCGLIGPETAGWFKREIEDLGDIQGLKIRFAGLGGKVLERLGASVTMIPPGEIFQALEKGAIDASEYSLPIVDQTMGFGRIAKFNYFPGWHQPFTATHLIVNLEQWEALATQDRSLFELACTAAVTRHLSQAEASQGRIIAGFQDYGIQASILPVHILKELQRVTRGILDEEARRDAAFATILSSQRTFRKNYATWKSHAYLPSDF